MKVPLGDHKTRMQLVQEKPDLNIARKGFIEGRNHPDDVDGMINLFLRFHRIEVLQTYFQDSAYLGVPVARFAGVTAVVRTRTNLGYELGWIDRLWSRLGHRFVSRGKSVPVKCRADSSPAPRGAAHATGSL